MKKILIVDDEPNIITALSFLFEQSGYEVQTAFNGEAALKKLAYFEPNVIVLDVMMPVMDGFETALRIRKNLIWDDIPIVFLTAKGTQQDKLMGYKSGGEYYISKPFDNQQLLNIIADIMMD